MASSETELVFLCGPVDGTAHTVSKQANPEKTENYDFLNQS